MSARTLMMGLALALAGGCASSSTSDKASAEPGPPANQATTAASAAEPRGPGGVPGGICAMRLSGTQVTVEETTEGAAFVFTNAEQTEPLQERVRKMAQMHNKHHGSDAAAAGQMAKAPGHCRCKRMQDHEQMPPSEARAEPTAEGAKLVLSALNPEQIDELRTQMKAHAERMSSGQCAMMSQK